MTNLITITTEDARRLSVIATRTGAHTVVDMISAGAKMQMISELKRRMRSSIVEFFFLKKNGQLRRAFGTTMPSLAVKHINGNGCRRELLNTTPFFDVEAGEWRSLRYESIIKVC